MTRCSLSYISGKDTKNLPSKELFRNYSEFLHHKNRNYSEFQRPKNRNYSEFSYPKDRNYSIFHGAVIQIKCKIKSTAVKSMIYLQKNVMQIRGAIKNTMEHNAQSFFWFFCVHGIVIFGLVIFLSLDAHYH